jgi:hypothetical protein
MKTVINIIILSILLSAGSAFGQNEKIVASGTFEGLTIQGVRVGDLVMMDKNFKGLHDALGPPIESRRQPEFAEPGWVFTYNGFELTYIQLSSRGPELLKAVVNSPKVNFKIDKNNLFEINKPDSMLRNNSFLKGKKIENDLDDYLKFEGEIQYIEFEYCDDKLNSITFKRDMQI